LPGLRQFYGTIASVKQKKSQLFFQCADLLAHSRLSNEVIPGGIGKAFCLRYSDKVVDLLDGHRDGLLSAGYW